MIDNNSDLVTIAQASKWAAGFLKKNVTTSNISYLIQYALIKKERGKIEIVPIQKHKYIIKYHHGKCR